MPKEGVAFLGMVVFTFVLYLIVACTNPGYVTLEQVSQTLDLERFGAEPPKKTEMKIERKKKEKKKRSVKTMNLKKYNRKDRKDPATGQELAIGKASQPENGPYQELDDNSYRVSLKSSPRIGSVGSGDTANDKDESYATTEAEVSRRYDSNSSHMYTSQNKHSSKNVKMIAPINRPGSRMNTNN